MTDADQTADLGAAKSPAPETTFAASAAAATGQDPLAVSAGKGDDEDSWSSVLIVAGAPSRLPPGKDRKVIVVQSTQREEPAVDEEAGGLQGTHRNPSLPAIVQKNYPKGADAYLRFDNAIDFGDNQPVLTLGDNLRPAGSAGLARRMPYINIGPASPVYAAINYAILKGAGNITIDGLSKEEQLNLAPWLEHEDFNDKAKIAFT